ncbi:hypothetical protein L198_07277 [Cryptococcus wingfieldii CBS 7118]|uniref:HTH CENPB-type domain-containing protein n=1 Tax=Cryptococcus wingfieldii CBS 7118 TaxID=1295528 RepID=A0A1E3IDA2_9TREE|nr:hypothetical protein L198_07277 [Cryptococcus wingfieldii CBS 7118]ODN86583.1 hypothetical protein L198_07277 [Cryptococcus wingfieldii CBS 7118]
MTDPVDSAVQYKRSHPKESFAKVANRFNVAPTTLNNRYHKKHASHATNNPRKLSVIQEKVLVDRINTYAERGTVLTQARIRELGQALHGRALGERWGSTFVERHREELDSGFYGCVEDGRQGAETSEDETYDSVDLSNPPSQASQPPPPAPSPGTPLGPRRRGRGALRNWKLDQIVALAQSEAEAEMVKAETVRVEKELEDVRAARAAMALDWDTGEDQEAVQDLPWGLYDVKYRDDNREALRKRKER